MSATRRRVAAGAQTHALHAGPEAAGARLDRWLAERLPALSRSRLHDLIERGLVTVDGHGSRPSARLREGQAVEVRVPAPTPAIPAPEALPLRIVHEDERLLVVDKPAGMVVHPGAGRSGGTLVNALLHHASGLSGIGGVARPGIVHRLDKGTSGLMVVAKDDEAHQRLSRAFAERRVDKEYRAVVLGVPKQPEGSISAPIGRHPVRRQRMSVAARGGRAATTHWAVVERLDGAALLAVRIETGRTHQIRVHLASIGHPVAGDTTYGGTRQPASQHAASRRALAALARPALHAAVLAFPRPDDGEMARFESPLPDDLTALVEALRG